MCNGRKGAHDRRCAGRACEISFHAQRVQTREFMGNACGYTKESQKKTVSIQPPMDSISRDGGWIRSRRPVNRSTPCELTASRDIARRNGNVTVAREGVHSSTIFPKISRETNELVEDRMSRNFPARIYDGARLEYSERWLAAPSGGKQQSSLTPLMCTWVNAGAPGVKIWRELVISSSKR